MSANIGQTPHEKNQRHICGEIFAGGYTIHFGVELQTGDMRRYVESAKHLHTEIFDLRDGHNRSVISTPFYEYIQRIAELRRNCDTQFVGVLYIS